MNSLKMLQKILIWMTNLKFADKVRTIEVTFDAIMVLWMIKKPISLYLDGSLNYTGTSR